MCREWQALGWSSGFRCVWKRVVVVVGRVVRLAKLAGTDDRQGV